jgi:hypothetical protein
MVYGTPGQVVVTVSASGPVTGSVELREGDLVVASGTLAEDGTATLEIPGTALAPGVHHPIVRYLGDADNEPSQQTVTVEVSKAGTDVRATASPDTLKFKKGTTDIHAAVDAGGADPGGTLVVLDGDRELGRAPVAAGRATIPVGPFDELGTRTLTVRYLGDEVTAASRTTVTIEVVRRSPKD